MSVCLYECVCVCANDIILVTKMKQPCVPFPLPLM